MFPNPNSTCIADYQHSHTFSLDLLWSNDPPTVNESYVVCLALDCLIAIVNAISKLVESSEEDKKVIQTDYCMSELNSVCIEHGIKFMANTTRIALLVVEQEQ